MKRFYKPLERRPSRQASLSKQIVDRVAFDDDDMENVDDFWAKATAQNNEVLSDSFIFDDSVVNKNKIFKKSFDVEYQNDLDTIEVSGMSDSIEPCEISNFSFNEECDSVNPIIDNKDNDRINDKGNYINNNDRNNDSNINNNIINNTDNNINNNITNNVNNNVNNNDNNININNNTDNTDKSSTTNKIIFKRRNMFDDGNDKSTLKKRIYTKELDVKNTSAKKKNNSKDKIIKLSPHVRKRRQTIYKVDSFIEEAFRIPQPKEEKTRSIINRICVGHEMIAINDIRAPMPCKSGFTKYFEKGKFVLGGLYLEYGASVINEESINSILFTVVKGKVKMNVNESEFIVGVGGVALVNQGWIYSIEAVSKTGSVISMTYIM